MFCSVVDLTVSAELFLCSPSLERKRDGRCLMRGPFLCGAKARSSGLYTGELRQLNGKLYLHERWQKRREIKSAIEDPWWSLRFPRAGCFRCGLMMEERAVCRGTMCDGC